MSDSSYKSEVGNLSDGGDIFDAGQVAGHKVTQCNKCKKF